MLHNILQSGVHFHARITPIGKQLVTFSHKVVIIPSRVKLTQNML